jgi:hypothetical protein
MLRTIVVVLALTSPLAAQAPRKAAVETFRLPAGAESFAALLAKHFKLPNDSLGKSYALLVGVSTYKAWTSLESPRKDLLKLREYLLRSAGFDEVTILADGVATFANVNQLMEDYYPAVANAKPGGRFLFYFSGHGDTRWKGTARERGYLILGDTPKGSFGSAISMDNIQLWAQNFADARQVLFIVDTCMSGLAGRELKGDYSAQIPAAQLLKERGVFLMTAGRADEDARGGSVWGGSLFTEALIAGLHSGAADADKNAIISTYELYNYVRAVVGNESKWRQTPLLRNMGNELYDAGEFIFLNPKTAGAAMTGAGEFELTAPLLELKGDAISPPIEVRVVANLIEQDLRTERVVEIHRELREHNSLAPTNRQFVDTFPPVAGRRIVEIKVVRESDNNVGDLTTTIDAAGNAYVRYALTSGPLFDRWGAWLHAKLLLTELASSGPTSVTISDGIVIDQYGTTSLAPPPDLDFLKVKSIVLVNPDGSTLSEVVPGVETLIANREINVGVSMGAEGVVLRLTPAN